jgi:cell fate regulator YaaT (PSP1 superfamily)
MPTSLETRFELLSTLEDEQAFLGEIAICQEDLTRSVFISGLATKWRHLDPSVLLHC